MIFNFLESIYLFTYITTEWALSAQNIAGFTLKYKNYVCAQKYETFFKYLTCRMRRNPLT